VTQAELLRHVADAFEALGIRNMISEDAVNIIHPESGLKIDVFVNKDSEDDRLRLERRQRLPLVPGREAYFARPEDLILYKLLYGSEGGSELHIRDVLGILRVLGAELDTRYVADWANHRIRRVWPNGAITRAWP